MNKEYLAGLNIEDSAKAILSMSPDDLVLLASHLTLEQMLAGLAVIQEDNDPTWKEKTRILLANTLNIRWLEAAGKVLTAEQTVEFLDYCQRIDKGQSWKLPALAVGLPHDRFAKVLTTASPEQMDMLKNEGMAEPLQFQLRALSQEWLYEIDRLCSLGNNYEQEILKLNLNQLDKVTYDEILKKFEMLEFDIQTLLDSINKALEVTWHTNRIDLIEKFSLVKELCQKALVVIVGGPRTNTDAPTGLYGFFEEQLSEVFGHSSDLDRLKDEDSGMDALGKFNIWHPEDYWDYGLIPQMGRKEALHLDPREFSEEVCENHKRKILQEVQKSLEDAGLVHVKDFKLKGIWSPQLFKAFLDSRQ